MSRLMNSTAMSNICEKGEKQEKCAIQLPDDVLITIGSFLEWDDVFASRYRLVCRAFRFGIDLTARIISLHTPDDLYRRFRRQDHHFGPPRCIPLGVWGVAQPTTIDGSWRSLLGQVFGVCMECGGSSRWIIRCNLPKCEFMVCISCVESTYAGSVSKCCGQWYCLEHKKLKNCSRCNRMCCRSCGNEQMVRHYRYRDSYMCSPCNNLECDQDMASYNDELLENAEEYAYYNDRDME